MLDTTTVANIKASEGIFRAADVAKHYDVHRSTVVRIWKGQAHATIVPAPDFPDIRIDYRPQDKAEDLRILMERGMSIKEAADELGMARSTAYLLRGLFV